jgi:cellulose synthase/poly-beta-1,6-N-acetylglucosamine synthase-like glycosyltransferase
MIWFNQLRVNDPKSATAYANGAFILISRDCYNAAGGFEAVKARINEDMQFARLVKKTGHRLVIVPNDDLYTVRMYESFAAIWAGWTRIFYGSFDSLRRLVLSILLVTVFSLMPWASLGFAAGLLLLNRAVSPATWLLTGTAIAACLAQTTVMCRFYAVNRSHPIYGLGYPVAAVLGLAILLNALFRRAAGGTVTWRGTAYQDGKSESRNAAAGV